MYSDNDFRPNILDLSHSQATEDDKSAASEQSSIQPMEAVHMMSDLELSEGPLVLGNNTKFTVDDQEPEDLDVVSEVRSISKNLVEEEEPCTVDEVTEEIEEDVQSKLSESAPSSTSLALSDRKSHKKPQWSAHSSKHSSQHSSHHQRHHSSNHSPRHSSHRHHKNISTKGSSQPKSLHKKEHIPSQIVLILMIFLDPVKKILYKKVCVILLHTQVKFHQQKLSYKVQVKGQLKRYYQLQLVVEST